MREDVNEVAIEPVRKNAAYVDEQIREMQRGEHVSISRRLSVIYSDIFENIEPLRLYDAYNHADLHDFIVSNSPYIRTDVIETLMSYRRISNSSQRS